MEVVEGGFEEQMKQVLKNLTAVVEASGSSLDKVVKTTVRLSSFQFKTSQTNFTNAGISQVDG
jgi:enamine deaminase RidA (YjgF/YER057c/UK114 family)